MLTLSPTSTFAPASNNTFTTSENPRPAAQINPIKQMKISILGNTLYSSYLIGKCSNNDIVLEPETWCTPRLFTSAPCRIKVSTTFG